MINGIDHIGIAVRSLSAAIPRYERVLGRPCERIETVTHQDVRVAFFEVEGSRIELLEPITEQSPIARFIAKRGEGLHHIALRSSALAVDLARAVEGGCEQLSGVPSGGAHGAQIAFLHPRGMSGVLVELCAPAALAEPGRATDNRSLSIQPTTKNFHE